MHSETSYLGTDHLVNIILKLEMKTHSLKIARIFAEKVIKFSQL